MEEFDKESMFFILKDLKSDLKSMDNKWENQLKEYGASLQKVRDIDEKVRKLNILVQTGNGKPSILVQLNDLSNKIDYLTNIISSKQNNVREELDYIKEEFHRIRERVGIKTPKEVKIERWKAVGKIAGVIAVVIPGVIAFLESFVL